MYSKTVYILKQVLINHGTEDLCSMKHFQTEDVDNVKPGHGPLSRSKATPPIIKRHTFLVALSLRRRI